MSAPRFGGLFPFAGVRAARMSWPLYLEASKHALEGGGQAWDRATEAAEIIGFEAVYR